MTSNICNLRYIFFFKNDIKKLTKQFIIKLGLLSDYVYESSHLYFSHHLILHPI